MLCLTRSRGEAICIGREILIRVLEVGGGRVKIGVTAPPSVAVDRLELRRQKRIQGRRQSPGR
ncbi:MAG TPA: carbon storage regulator [Phycisphaerae bacterium]|nr:carbon storage regulator [Phycisphaerae bacterium]